MKISELILKGIEILGKDKYFEILSLLEKASGLSKEKILGSYDLELPEKVVRNFLRFILKRKNNFPLQYILGKVEFWSINFKIRKEVFIPRPETELIVEKIVDVARGKALMIADVGTGCGNIAISLAKELPESKILATDISLRAIELARENAEIHGVGNRVKFLKGNMFEPFEKLCLQNSFDVICSNPPYVAVRERKHLPQEISKFEPKRALFSGGDGLNFIRKFVRLAPLYLKKKGRVYLEIGDGMEKEVLDLFKNWAHKEVYKDFCQKPRVVMAEI